MTTYDARKYRRWKSQKLISEMMEYIASLQQDWARERFNLLERAIGAETERDQLKVKLYADQDRNHRSDVGRRVQQSGGNVDGGDATGATAAVRPGSDYAGCVGIGGKIGGAEAQGWAAGQKRVRTVFGTLCPHCTTGHAVDWDDGRGLRCGGCGNPI